MSGLLGKVKVSQLGMGVHENCIITAVDVNDRKGANGPINKMIYIKFGQLDAAGKRKAESELAWWKPEVGNEFFKTNLLEMCIQLHGILACYMTEEEAFEAFDGVFEDSGISNHLEIESKNWKKSEVDILFSSLKNSFAKAMASFINKPEAPIRVKITTNFKGEDIDIPKFGKFTESMDVTESHLKFSDSELKTHSKSGNVAKKATSLNATI